MGIVKSLVISIVACPMLCMCNDVNISNVLFGVQDLVLNTQEVQFDVTWKNSWRTSTLESNHDASWLFLKYRIEGTSVWAHGSLKLGPTLPPAGAAYIVASDGMGAFVLRDADGIGDVAFLGCKLLWDRAADGVSASAIVEICMIALEMVFVPGDEFLLGDGSQSPAAMLAASDSLPFTVSTENSIAIGGSASTSLYSINTGVQSTSDDFSTGSPQVLPGTFPKGVNGAYQMKYEIDQGLYVQMLNKLDQSQATARFMNANSFGNTVTYTFGSGNNYSTTTPDRPCNFLSWRDLAAVADWTGLRPMSELEYEKACRGTRPAVSDELCTGSSSVATATHTVTDQGLPTEALAGLQTNTGHFNYTTTQSLSRPLRTGIMAASAVNKTRLETGATRYGAMEMSGNTWEMVVSIGSPQGRGFTAENGNGMLNVSGDADVVTWPGTNALGSGIKGGGVFSTLDKLRVSDRTFVNYAVVTREPDIGGRLIRSIY